VAGRKALPAGRTQGHGACLHFFPGKNQSKYSSTTQKFVWLKVANPNDLVKYKELMCHYQQWEIKPTFLCLHDDGK
jgi:hypothetical protein